MGSGVSKKAGGQRRERGQAGASSSRGGTEQDHDTFGTEGKRKQAGAGRKAGRTDGPHPVAFDNDEEEMEAWEDTGRISRARNLLEQSEEGKRRMKDSEISGLLEHIALNSARHGYDRHIQDCMASLGIENLADEEVVESTLVLPRSSLKAAR